MKYRDDCGCDTHIVHHRLEARRGDATNATVGYCGAVVPDVDPVELFPDRDADAMHRGLGHQVADVRSFATDDEASCNQCREAREGARPGWLRRTWRRLFHRRQAEPAPDLLPRRPDDGRHPEDDQPEGTF